MVKTGDENEAHADFDESLVQDYVAQGQEDQTNVEVGKHLEREDEVELAKLEASTRNGKAVGNVKEEHFEQHEQDSVGDDEQVEEADAERLEDGEVFEVDVEVVFFVNLVGFGLNVRGFLGGILQFLPKEPIL